MLSINKFKMPPNQLKGMFGSLKESDNNSLDYRVRYLKWLTSVIYQRLKMEMNWFQAYGYGIVFDLNNVLIQ